jgi:hypothetical protein
LRERQVLVDVRLEKILDHRGAVDRLRFRMLDVIHRRLRDALREKHDAIRDFLRQDAVVAPNHGGNRDLDVGKDVRSGIADRIAAHQHDQHRQHDERVRSLQGYSNDPHGLLRLDGRNVRRSAASRRAYRNAQRCGGADKITCTEAPRFAFPRCCRPEEPSQK